MYIYVIYKPRQLGAYNKYMTLVLGHRKFAIDNPSPFEDKGRIFAVYTVMAVVHMICTMMKSY